LYGDFHRKPINKHVVSHMINGWLVALYPQLIMVNIVKRCVINENSLKDSANCRFKAQHVSRLDNLAHLFIIVAFMRQKTIFLIDDDPEDLQFMRDAMNRVDSTILMVSFLYPEEAIKLLTNELIILPDHIFIDMNMPKITGEDCLRHLRTNSKFLEIPITIYSTSMPKEVSDRLLKKGANYTFVKPNTENEYTVVLENIIFGNAVPNSHLDGARH
jgi:CheY-like chemotaxis protein